MGFSCSSFRSFPFAVGRLPRVLRIQLIVAMIIFNCYGEAKKYLKKKPVLENDNGIFLIKYTRLRNAFQKGSERCISLKYYCCHCIDFYYYYTIASFDNRDLRRSILFNVNIPIIFYERDGLDAVTGRRFYSRR